MNDFYSPTDLPLPPETDSAIQSALAHRAKYSWHPWSESECQELQEFNRQAGNNDLSIAAVEALADADTLAIVAGQQAGLFVSPLYTLYKALAAIKWAKRLTNTLNRKVVPLFWIASDDHDFDEIRTMHYLDQSGKVCSSTYTPQAAVPQNPSIFDIPAEEETLKQCLKEVFITYIESDMKTYCAERYERHAEESHNLEDFFARGLADLIGSEQLILLPSRLPTIRRRAHTVMKCEIMHPLASTMRLEEAARRLKQKDQTAPIHRRGDEINFFVYRNKSRCRVTWKDSEFQIHLPGEQDPEKATAKSLLAELESTPENFSPNVITRPVVQDNALPAIGMVAGPGEQKYLSFLADAGIHNLHRVPPSAILARPRLLLVEPRIERHLSKYDLDDTTLAHEDWDAVRKTILSTGEHFSLTETLEQLPEQLSAAIANLEKDLGSFSENPAVRSAMEKTEKSVLKSAEQMRQRIMKEIHLKHETNEAHLSQILNALYPKDAPQERVLGTLAPFLFNFGQLLIPWLIESMNLDNPHLQILYLSKFLERSNG